MMDRWEPRPLPTVTPETADYWAGCAEGKLLLRRCRDCGSVYHYPRAVCPDCAGDRTGWIEADGTGELYSFAVMDERAGWPEEALPHVLAYVELAEGPRMVTNVVDADPGRLSIGDPLEVRFVATDRDGVAIPVFTPIER